MKLFQDYSKIVNRMNSKTNFDSEEYWGDIKGWISSYRCSSCRCLMTKKDPSRKPQRIYSCGHVVCAKCIVESYFVKLNPECPVYGCGKLVNPSDPAPVEPFTFADIPAELRKPDIVVEEEKTSFDTYMEILKENQLAQNNAQEEKTTLDTYMENLKKIWLKHEIEEEDDKEEEEYENDEYKYEKYKNVHYCGDPNCRWDCGELSCGCIDVCRGACGLNTSLCNEW